MWAGTAKFSKTEQLLFTKVTPTIRAVMCSVIKWLMAAHCRAVNPLVCWVKWVDSTHLRAVSAWQSVKVAVFVRWTYLEREAVIKGKDKWVLLMQWMFTAKQSSKMETGSSSIRGLDLVRQCDYKIYIHVHKRYSLFWPGSCACAQFFFTFTKLGIPQRTFQIGLTDYNSRRYKTETCSYPIIGTAGTENY